MGESLWRISSTLFGHIQSDEILQPLPCFVNEDSHDRYPPILAGDQVGTYSKYFLLYKNFSWKLSTLSCNLLSNNSSSFFNIIFFKFFVDHRPFL